MTNSTRARAKKSLNALKAESKNLDSLDDLIRDQIREIEHELGVLRIGIRLSVVVEEDYASEHTKLLCYDKVGGTWGLYIEEGFCGDPETWQSTRLTQCSRDERADAVSTHIVKLLENAAGSLKKTSEQRTLALSTGNAVLAVLLEATGDDK